MDTIPRTKGLLLLPLLLLAAVSCGDDDPVTVEPDIAQIQVSPSSSDLDAVGATVQLDATALDAQGNQVPNISFTWSSGSPSVATVSSTGLVTAAGEGQAQVSAEADGVTGTATVTVALQVAAVEVTPAEASVAVGGTVDFAAEALDGNDNPISGATVGWSSSDEAVATVDGTGQATGRATGEATITAQSDGVTGTATLTVIPAVASVDVAPDSSRLTAVDDTVHLSATVVDTEGDTLSDPAVAWSSRDTTVATVDSTGTVTARGQGSARIMATSGGVSDSAVVVVDPQVAGVSVVPDSATVEVGQTTGFSATVADANDNPIPGAIVTWTSSDEGVATVDSTGQATGQAAGTAEITATSGGLSASATLTVTAQAQVNLAQLSGDDQNGKTQQAFGDSLVVEVTDGQGAPVSGVTVDWAVAQGEATLSQSSSTTDAQGQAWVTVTAGASTGDPVVEASYAQAQGGPVTFTLHTTVMAVQIIDNAFVDVDGDQNANFVADIEVGDTLEFTYVQSGAVVHTVTSTDTPAGGASFDSGNLDPGDTFRFAPQTEGTWTFFCEFHPSIMVDATINVTDPGAAARSDAGGYRQ